MAYNYACGQYNDAFKPSRLGNWSDSTNSCNRRCQKPVKQFRGSGYLDFLADEHGRLLPHVRDKIKKKPNHWGLPVLRVWDETCNKPLLMRPFAKLGYHELPRYFKNEQSDADCIGVDSCNSFCSGTNSVKIEFQNLRRLKLPIIWLYGYPQKGICLIRKHYIYQIAKNLGFKYIDMDQVMFEWGRRYIHTPPNLDPPALIPFKPETACTMTNLDSSTVINRWSKEMLEGQGDSSGRKHPCFDENPYGGPCPHSTTEPELRKEKREALKAASKHIQRFITIMYRIMPDPNEAYTTQGLLELLKCVLLESYPCRGYIIDGFPINLEESIYFEKIFWPVAGGIYLINKDWELNRKVQPEVHEPVLFRRIKAYNEKEVEFVVRKYAYKSIKIHYSPCVGNRELEELNESITEMLTQYWNILKGTFSPSSAQPGEYIAVLGGAKTSKNANQSNNINDESPEAIASKPDLVVPHTSLLSIEGEDSDTSCYCDVCFCSDTAAPSKCATSILMKKPCHTIDEPPEAKASKIDLITKHSSQLPLESGEDSSDISCYCEECFCSDTAAPSKCSTSILMKKPCHAIDEPSEAKPSKIDLLTEHSNLLAEPEDNDITYENLELPFNKYKPKIFKETSETSCSESSTPCCSETNVHDSSDISSTYMVSLVDTAYNSTSASANSDSIKDSKISSERESSANNNNEGEEGQVTSSLESQSDLEIPEESPEIAGTTSDISQNLVQPTEHTDLSPPTEITSDSPDKKPSEASLVDKPFAGIDEIVDFDLEQTDKTMSKNSKISLETNSEADIRSKSPELKLSELSLLDVETPFTGIDEIVDFDLEQTDKPISRESKTSLGRHSGSRIPNVQDDTNNRVWSQPIIDDQRFRGRAIKPWNASNYVAEKTAKNGIESEDKDVSNEVEIVESDHLMFPDNLGSDNLEKEWDHLKQIPKDTTKFQDEVFHYFHPHEHKIKKEEKHNYKHQNFQGLLWCFDSPSKEALLYPGTKNAKIKRSPTNKEPFWTKMKRKLGASGPAVKPSKQTPPLSAKERLDEWNKSHPKGQWNPGEKPTDED